MKKNLKAVADDEPLVAPVVGMSRKQVDGFLHRLELAHQFIEKALPFLRERGELEPVVEQYFKMMETVLSPVIEAFQDIRDNSKFIPASLLEKGVIVEGVRMNVSTEVKPSGKA